MTTIEFRLNFDANNKAIEELERLLEHGWIQKKHIVHVEQRIGVLQVYNRTLVAEYEKELRHSEPEKHELLMQNGFL